MRKEKTAYDKAELKIVNLEKTDLITTSGWGFSGEDDTNTDSGGWT